MRFHLSVRVTVSPAAAALRAAIVRGPRRRVHGGARAVALHELRGEVAGSIVDEDRDGIVAKGGLEAALSGLRHVDPGLQLPRAG